MTATGPNLPAVTAPVTLPPDFTIHNIAALVRDVAIQLEDLPAVLRKHGLSSQQYDSLANNQFFQNILQEAVKNWHSPQSTKERIALTAAIALEDALPKVAARMTVGKEDLSDVVETAKLFADLAGMGPKAQQQTPTPGEKFSININLGGDVQHIETTRPTQASPGTIQIDAQRESDRISLRPLIEGESKTVEIRPFSTETPNPLSVSPFHGGISSQSTAKSETPPPDGKVETGL